MQPFDDLARHAESALRIIELECDGHQAPSATVLLTAAVDSDRTAST